MDKRPRAQPALIAAANDGSDLVDAPDCGPATRDGLAILVLAHVATLVIFAAWAFGGNTGWSRFALSCWASLGAGLTACALITRARSGRSVGRMLAGLWPLALLDLFVLVSCANPNYRQVFDGDAVYFVRDPSLPRWDWLPSSARPDLSRAALWLFNGVYLSCFNLLLTARRRRHLRALLAIVAVNALALAVLGTLQKLIGFHGPLFGLLPTRQPYFFSSFLYHNHWGAFTLMTTALALGIALHASRHSAARDRWHSPAFAWLVVAVLLAATIPLSASRSSSVLVLVLGCGTLIHWLVGAARRRRSHDESVFPPVVSAAGVLLLAAILIGGFSAPVIKARLLHTQAQLSEMHRQGDYVPRGALYRDTLRMIRERPWTGWGMSSYETAFFPYNSRFESSDGPNRVYREAHSDWLQSLAEVGVIGTGLLLLCGVVPLRSAGFRLHFADPLVPYLLTGCALVLLYAMLEFPLENGAVLVAFWLCFFAALAHDRLDRSRHAPL